MNCLWKALLSLHLSILFGYAKKASISLRRTKLTKVKREVPQMTRSRTHVEDNANKSLYLWILDEFSVKDPFGFLEGPELVEEGSRSPEVM